METTARFNPGLRANSLLNKKVLFKAVSRPEEAPIRFAVFQS